LEHPTKTYGNLLLVIGSGELILGLLVLHGSVVSLSLHLIPRCNATLFLSVEFGLCRHSDGSLRAYGAGLLSSFGELQYACSPTRPAGGTATSPDYRIWDPRKASTQPYPITEYQPVYFVAESLRDAKQRMLDFCDSMQRGFLIKYDSATQTASADRAIVQGDYLVTLQK
jgi:phenylalanine-4-hydroxylase